MRLDEAHMRKEYVKPDLTKRLQYLGMVAGYLAEVLLQKGVKYDDLPRGIRSLLTGKHPRQQAWTTCSTSSFSSLGTRTGTGTPVRAGEGL